MQKSVFAAKITLMMLFQLQNLNGKSAQTGLFLLIQK
jgi:hypothetical protein